MKDRFYHRAKDFDWAISDWEFDDFQSQYPKTVFHRFE